jgi:hypothetical protein
MAISSGLELVDPRRPGIEVREDQPVDAGRVATLDHLEDEDLPLTGLGHTNDLDLAGSG